VNSYRIVLADDQPVFRQILRRMLAGEMDLEVVGEADDGPALLNLLSQSVIAPDLAILDLSMPGMSGIETARRISSMYPSIKALIVTVHDEPYCITKAFLAGASGYVCKDRADTELLKAIEVIRSGRRYKPPLSVAMSEQDAGRAASSR